VPDGDRGASAVVVPLTLLTPSDAPDAVLDLTVVVPYYNPGAQLRSTVERAAEVLKDIGISFEIVTVSDGSTDGSDATLEGVHPDVVVRVALPEHAGKGTAVRAGLARGRGRYLGFIDGDGDVPPELLADFVEVVRATQPDVVLGSKRHRDSDVVYPLARRMYSWGYQQLVRVLFRLDVRDTQAGIKLVRREVLAQVLPLMVEQGYAFDLELLVIARRLGHGDLVEAPVRIGRRFTSTVSLKVVFEMLRDTFAIWWRLRVTHRYELAARPVGQESGEPTAA
jgi:glycosyltransferase involved in cell wall biosynthesis